MILGHRLMKAGRSIGHKMGAVVNAIGHKYIPQAIEGANTVVTVANAANKVRNLLTRGR